MEFHQYLRVSSAVAVLIAGVFGASAFAQTSPQITPAMLGELPMVAHVEISPNGETAAMQQSGNGKTFIVFYDVAGSQNPVAVELGESRPRALTWGNDEKLLMRATKTVEIATGGGLKKYEFAQFFTIDRNSGEITRMLAGSDAFNTILGAGVLLHTLPNKPKKVLIAQYDPSGRPGQNSRRTYSRIQGKANYQGGYNLYEVDLYSGREAVVETGGPETIDWIVNSQGEAVAYVDYDALARERKIFARTDGKKFNKVTTYKEPHGAGAHLIFQAAGASDLRPLVLSYHGDDKLGIFDFDLTTGEISTAQFQHEKFDTDHVVFDPHTGRGIGAAYTDDFSQVHYFDEPRRKLLAKAAKPLAGAALTIVSESADLSRVVIRAAYANQPADYYLFNPDAGELHILGSEYPPAAAKIASRTRYDSLSADGLQITGYITRPANGGAKALPLIVLPHGGPEGRDDMEFDWWAAFYASKGYAVYQPNFRGSDGYGDRFRRAGFRQWGRKMQDDVTAGVNKLVADGVADPDRICIVGASYGGYAALAGAAFTPDLYRCAVSVNGVSDLLLMLSEEKRSGKYSLAYWENRIGDLGSERAQIKAVSPVEHVAVIKAPILLLHGKDDTVVPIAHATRMRDALKKAGKKVDFVELKGEDHWLSDGASRTTMLAQSIAFIDKHIGIEEHIGGQ